MTFESVHPRLRGELLRLSGITSVNAGSSPLTRGTRMQKLAVWLALRFIPAYAGNSYSFEQTHSRGAVHPRLRGELLHKPYNEGRFLGSSPLTRGTPKALANDICVVRFIPAYAGNSVNEHNNILIEAVHPRLRGELTVKLETTKNVVGSSPLTRGTHALTYMISSGYRFIPAYAGNSVKLPRAAETSAVHPRLRGELKS